MAVQGVSIPTSRSDNSSTERCLPPSGWVSICRSMNGASGFGACNCWLISTSTSLLPLAMVIATVLRIAPQRWSSLSSVSR
jgi:hypothetical protein